MIDISDIQRAAERLQGNVVRTPLIESDWLNNQLDGRVLFKAECLQRTGSFKIRGATSKLASLDEDQRRRGVIAYSSGNHAQGVAAAAKMLGINAKIVIPRDAPELKLANTRAYGASVVLYERETEDREAITDDIARKEGLTIIPPYDDELVIAGQGTVGLEIMQQLQQDSISADAILAPCGGGGLIAGTATAIKPVMPDIEIFAVEPEGFDDTRRSLLAGERQANAPGASSICDAIVTPTPGELTFEINRKLLAGGFAVSDEAVIEAMTQAFTRLKLVVEPGGVVGLAALLCGAFPLNGKTAVVILSGGNMDIQSLAKFQKLVN
ncbi:MAG: threonine/serine dehydratase [Gammaproteobacteria bacterium]